MTLESHLNINLKHLYTMTNLEKIERVDTLIQKEIDLVKFSEEKYLPGLEPDCAEAHMVREIILEHKENISALKYARKAIQLMQDLVNDEGGQHGN